MCGIFTQMMSWSELVELADLIGAASDGPEDRTTQMRWARVIALDENGKRQSVRMRWGLVPPWSEEPNTLRGTIHARAETIDEKRTYKGPFAKRRGILVVRTFNEGEEVGSKTRQYVITPKNGKPIAIAVIWERWTGPDGAPLLTFAMITVPPNTLIGTITDRMPAVLQPEQWATWLGEGQDREGRFDATVEELKAMLVPVDGDWDMAPQAPRPPPPRGRPPTPSKPEPEPGLL